MAAASSAAPQHHGRLRRRLGRGHGFFGSFLAGQQHPSQVGADDVLGEAELAGRLLAEGASGPDEDLRLQFEATCRLQNSFGLLP